MKLDIGCGQHKQPGFTGVDIGDFPGVDVVCPIESLSEKFDPESIDELYTRDLLEHVDDLFVSVIVLVCFTMFLSLLDVWFVFMTLLGI